MFNMPASSTITVVPGPRSNQMVRVGVVEVVEELGDGVCQHAGLRSEDPGRLGCRGEPDHRAGVCVEIGDGGFEHACLAGTGGADDEDESIVSCDRTRCVVLTVVEGVVRDRGRRVGSSVCASSAQVMMCSS